VAKTISIKTLTSTRGTATITWTGNALTNNWDLTITTNWLNAGVLDYFIANDNVIFNATGAANPTVNIVGSLLPSSVVVDAATDYAFTNTSGSIDGTGGLTKNNSGTLSIQTTNNYTGITTIGNGVIEASQLANSTLGSAIGAASSDSANLVISNATLRYIGDSVSTDHGATFTGTNGVIDVTNSATTLTVSGTLLGSGTLTKVGQGTLIVSGINSHGSTIVSNGILQINTTISAVGSGAIKFGGGTVRMNVSSQQTYPNALNVASASTLIAAGGNNNIVGGHWSGSGTLNLDMTSGGTFTINADMTTNFDGTILLADTSAGTFRFNSGGSSSGVQQSVGSPTATFDLGNSTVILANRNGGGDSFGNYQLGALAGGVSTFLRGSGNSGSSASTYHIGAKNLNTTFAGTIATGSGGGGAAVNIVKIGTGTFTLTGNSTYNGYTTISNGVLALSGSGAIGSTTNINIIAGTALDVSARDDGTLTLNNNQILRGNGTVLGSVTASSGSTVSPGTSIGLLTITNALNLQGGSTTLMELDATAGTNDVIAVQGGVAYGGTLQINLVNGTLAAGQIYKLFNAPSGQYSGSFDGGVSPASTNGLTWDTSKLTVDGTLKVIVATKPVIGNISISGSDLSFSGNNGIPNASFNLLSSTDVTLPLSSWTVVGAYTFDGSGNFSFTLSGAFDPNQPQVFYSVQY
jgi:fibronectin-binding autotransporter adhesin